VWFGTSRSGCESCACVDTRPESARKSQWGWVSSCVHAPAVTRCSPFPRRRRAVERGAEEPTSRFRRPPGRSTDETRIRQPASKGSLTGSEPAFASRNRGEIQLESITRRGGGLHPISATRVRETQRRLQLLYLALRSFDSNPEDLVYTEMSTCVPCESIVESVENVEDVHRRRGSMAR
jgi:hypothetical protein